MQQSPRPVKHYEIRMGKGTELNDVDEDTQSIFTSFSLASWLSFDYGVRVLSYCMHETPPYYIVRARKNRMEQSEEASLYVFVWHIDQVKLTIMHYVQDQPPPLLGVNPVMVRFLKHPDRLVIRIEDFKGYFNDMFDRPDRQRYREFSHLKKPNELEYRYIEPEDQRFQYESHKQHFHIAFQGGGAKGIAYIGAFQALNDLFPNRYIRSLIGSSAGGLISLAVSAGLQVKQILDVCLSLVETAKDRVIRHLEDITPQKRAFYDQVIDTIGRFLDDHGILTKGIFDIIRKDTMRDDVIEKLFEVLCGDNDTLRMMFSLEVPQIKKTKGSFFSLSSRSTEPSTQIMQTRLINFYGLLEGHLLNGDGIARISAGILRRFLLAKYNRDPKGFCKILGLDIVNRPNIVEEVVGLAEALTMNQYYLLTDRLQLTCTTVDLNDKVLRCLNHKTTPHLPVCKAVQMTASYPIAFEAIRWKKEWGKYYIHYAHTRKEIDLAGHQFTDGGFLSNFPIKFLDNESVRPMYFSHMSSNKTRIFGFGLEEVTEEEKEKANQDSSKAMDELSNLIKKRLPLSKIIYEQVFHTPPPKLIPVAEMTSLYDIPITKFIINLFEVLFQATDNFVRECFAKDIYLLEATVAIGKFVMNQSNLKENVRKHAELRDTLVKLSEEMQSNIYSCGHYIDYVKQYSNKLLHEPRIEDLAYVRGLLLNSLKNYVLYSLKGKKEKYHLLSSSAVETKQLEEVELTMRELLNRTEDINRHGVFRSDCLKEDISSLFDIIYRWEEQLTLSNIRNESVRLTLMRNFRGYFEYIRRSAVAEIDVIVDQIDRRISIERSEAIGNLRHFHDNKLAEDISKFSSNFPFKALPGYNEFKESMSGLGEYILTQKQEFQRNRTSIYEYLERMVSGGNSNNIHLVLESSGGITAKYYMDVYRLVNQYLFTNETKKTAYLIEKIADMVFRENSRRDPHYKFGIVDLVKFIIVKSDLHKYIERNYLQLAPIIDLGYMQFTISTELQNRLLLLLEKHRTNTARITSITCSSTQCYLSFLFTLGLDNTKILEEVDKVRELLEIDYAKINRNFYEMDWALPSKCKIRQFEETMWNSRYDFFKKLEESLKNNELEMDLDRIKRQFESEKESIMDSFHFVMDYVVAEEIKGHQDRTRSFEERMAERMALKYGKKDYRKMNERIGKDTKVAMQLIYVQFQSLIRHLVFTYARQQNLEYLVHQQDTFKRQAIWKGLIMTNLINVGRVKEHIQDLLAERNLPRDIRLKQYNDYCPVKIELTFTALDITSHCIEFINHHTYPQMPLWAAILTGAAYSPLFSPLRTKPSWSQRIDPNKQLRHLKSFFNGDRWWNLPVFVSGSMLVQLPLEYLTNRKIREVFYGGNRYTFLTFGVKPKTNIQRYVVEEHFYRRFLGLQQTVQLALSIRGIQASMFSKVQKNVVVSQLYNQDNLTFSIYYKELLRLPVSLGTLEFVKISKPGVIPRLLQESYYYTLEKFCEKKRTCIRVVLEGNRLTLRFISKERNNKDLHRKYKIYYKAQGQEVELRKELLEVESVLLSNALELRFLYIDRREVGNKMGRYAVFENHFRLDLAPFRYFNRYEGLFGFPYGMIINGAINPLKPANFELRPQYVGSTIPYVFIGRSLVDINRTGLYCEQCSSALHIKSPEEVLFEASIENVCSKCNDRRNVRYFCQQSYGDCAARYCVKCCKSQVIFRCHEGIFCDQGHQYRFCNQTPYLLKSEEVAYSKCDLCHQLTNSYFLDETCDTSLCQPCSAQFAPQELTL